MSNELNRIIFDAANRSGHEAATAMVPEPMAVVGRKEVWHVPEGMCGFAWVAFKGNTSFGRWALKNKIARKAYQGGLHLWVSDYGQSYDRKSAYAAAFAEVLRKHGVDAYADNRLD
jgi:hypothetical protein